MLKNLKEEVYKANMLLQEHGLIIFTWGNVSGIDRKKGLVVIKPSGVEYKDLSPEKMVVVSLETGEVVEGKLNPSTDTATHLELYRKFEDLGGVVHTHSHWATIFSQAGMNVPTLGTTHGDYFYGDIPCTRKMTEEEILQGDYEENTGKVIVETFKNIKPLEVPAVLVHSHGPFTFGKNPKDAVNNSVILEELSSMAWQNLLMNKNIENMQKELLEKHYKRKHGDNAYYGQIQK